MIITQRSHHGPVPDRSSTARTGLPEQHCGCDQHTPSVSVCYIVMLVLHRAFTKTQRPIWTLNRSRHYPAIHSTSAVWCGDLGGSNAAPWPRTTAQG